MKKKKRGTIDLLKAMVKKKRIVLRRGDKPHQWLSTHEHSSGARVEIALDMGPKKGPSISLMLEEASGLTPEVKGSVGARVIKMGQNIRLKHTLPVWFSGDYKSRSKKDAQERPANLRQEKAYRATMLRLLPTMELDQRDSTPEDREQFKAIREHLTQRHKDKIEKLERYIDEEAQRIPFPSRGFMGVLDRSKIGLAAMSKTERKRVKEKYFEWYKKGDLDEADLITSHLFNDDEVLELYLARTGKDKM